MESRRCNWVLLGYWCGAGDGGAGRGAVVGAVLLGCWSCGGEGAVGAMLWGWWCCWGAGAVGVALVLLGCRCGGAGAARALRRCYNGCGGSGSEKERSAQTRRARVEMCDVWAVSRQRRRERGLGAERAALRRAVHARGLSLAPGRGHVFRKRLVKDGGAKPCGPGAPARTARLRGPPVRARLLRRRAHLVAAVADFGADQPEVAEVQAVEEGDEDADHVGIAQHREFPPYRRRHSRRRTSPPHLPQQPLVSSRCRRWRCLSFFNLNQL